MTWIQKKSNRIVDAPTNLIKTANYVIAPILSDIFNYCMTNGCYPDQLKIAHVIPIYKKKGKKNAVAAGATDEWFHFINKAKLYVNSFYV